ncbi:hypothetical protein CBR_g18946 [Chara braunii]|uniref:Uncharacterized protein n=1 Tax=Chara braunii TaxID=69332 RepID=A0A388KWU4_CHABU|nr:hypothetical protein CBR_g18946 [Chara braunii]|eukprot:GBG74536.1 hypothetical protein CBR_g18946 [Chara braunii]
MATMLVIAGKAGNRQMHKPEEENTEMKELLQRIARREEEEEERKRRETEEARKKEENERKESEKLREEEAREARLEATIVRILTQKKDMFTVRVNPQAPAETNKSSPRSKARLIRELRNYIVESDGDSEEVKEETEKLIEVLESRKKKGKRVVAQQRTAANRFLKKKQTVRKGKKSAPEIEPGEEGFETPKKACTAECSSEGLIEYALTQTKILSGMKANEIRKICNTEGIEYTVKDQSIQDIVRCRTRLAYEGFLDRESPIKKPGVEGLE